MKKFENSGKYKHFKGGDYILVCSALCEGAEVILYQSLKSNSYWMRTPDDFFAVLKKDEEEYYRFKLIEKFAIKEAEEVFETFISRMKNGETITFENDLKQFAIDFSSPTSQPRVLEVK